MTDYSTDNRFNEGDRVELHPGCTLWMRGARYGTVESIFHSRQVDFPRYLVRMDNTAVRNPQVFAPERLRAI